MKSKYKTLEQEITLYSLGYESMCLMVAAIRIKTGTRTTKRDVLSEVVVVVEVVVVGSRVVGSVTSGGVTTGGTVGRVVVDGGST